MITIDSTHNGPPGSGHGGVTAGRVAELIDPGRAVVRFHVPIPLSVPLSPVRRPDGSVALCQGKATVVTARPLGQSLNVGSFDPLPAAVVARAEEAWMARYRDGLHSAPSCFGCGPDRPAGDGLGLRPGPVPGHDVHASSWVPTGSGPVPRWLVWAALDCAGAGVAMAAAPGERVVTGELAVEILAPVPAGAAALVIGRQHHTDGRRVVVHSAVLTADGSLVAVAEATWFTVKAARSDLEGAAY